MTCNLNSIEEYTHLYLEYPEDTYLWACGARLIADDVFVCVPITTNATNTDGEKVEPRVTKARGTRCARLRRGGQRAAVRARC